MRSILSFLIFFILVNATIIAYCQVERGGLPRSFQLQLNQKSQSQPVEIAAPDMLSIQQEDSEDVRLEKSYRVGVEVPVEISLSNAGQWDYLPGGGHIWRVTLICKGAQAIGLDYSELRLPYGADIFVYTPDHSYIIGAITSSEIPANNTFATRPLSGDELVIEYFEPEYVNTQAVIDVSGVVYIYRSFDPPKLQSDKSASSGNCEVNVNCEEGQNWQKQKQGVVKIQTKVTDTSLVPHVTSYFYCTGVLLNNTMQDFSGLMLTAAHCSKNEYRGVGAIPDDYNYWIFYFNYEYSGCSRTATKELTLVGAKKLAISETPSDMGSDFLLMNTLKNIPAQYNAYYCGWDVGNGNSSSGVCIHHPNGDVKKISTYTTMLGSDSYGNVSPNTHWIVKWAATKNGFGVTEGGSSGAPLFDDEGLVIGTLTGGLSSCSNTSETDMYGKVSYSWESNGTTADMQLKPWLDPENVLEGEIPKMHGSYNDKLAVADFSANTFIIPIGGTIDFQDLSAGKPTKWHWNFQGGKPFESFEQNPTGILFERFGAMNVKLVVSNSYNSDSIVKEGFIDVRAVVSPNPCTGVVNILTDKNNDSEITIEVYDYLGKIAQRFEYSGSASENYSITLPPKGNVFFIKVLQDNQVQTHKVIVVH